MSIECSRCEPRSIIFNLGLYNNLLILGQCSMQYAQQSRIFFLLMFISHKSCLRLVQIGRRNGSSKEDIEEERVQLPTRAEGTYLHPVFDMSIVTGRSPFERRAFAWPEASPELPCSYSLTKNSESAFGYVLGRTVRLSPPCAISTFACWPLRISPLITLSADQLQSAWR